MADKQLVVFRLGNEHYGLDIVAVEGIIKLQEITKVPHSPRFVEGITYLRDHVLPVVDLRKRYDVSDVKDTDATRIITVKIGEIQAGMIVDAVSEVITVDDKEIEKVSDMVITKSSEFVEGVIKDGNRLLLFVNLEKVLSFEEENLLQDILLAA